MTPIVLRSVISSSFIVPLYNAIMHCRAIGIIKKWQSLLSVPRRLTLERARAHCVIAHTMAAQLIRHFMMKKGVIIFMCIGMQEKLSCERRVHGQSRHYPPLASHCKMTIKRGHPQHISPRLTPFAPTKNNKGIR